MSTEQSYVGRGRYANPTEQTADTATSTATNQGQTSPTADNRSDLDYVNPANGELAEFWKPLPLFDLERFYEVSNTGKIRNLLTGSLAKTCFSKEGEFLAMYHPVAFKYTTVKVHRAVALAFVPNPKGLHWVKRKDNNKRNNRAANLDWVGSWGQRTQLAALLRQPFSEFILDRLQTEGRLSESERNRAGITTAMDDSMAPQLGQGAEFVAVPANPCEYPSLVGKVVAVVVKAKLFAFYLGRVVSIDADSVRVSRDNSEWPERVESWAVIASIAKVVSVLENTVN